MTPKIDNLMTKTFVQMIAYLEVVGLFLISSLIVILIGKDVLSYFNGKEILLSDILLFFIYLEVLAMAGFYLKTGKLPIRIPVYISIVAITRHIIIESQHLNYLEIIGFSTSILILTISVFVIKYSHTLFQKSQKKQFLN